MVNFQGRPKHLPSFMCIIKGKLLLEKNHSGAPRINSRWTDSQPEGGLLQLLAFSAKAQSLHLQNGINNKATSLPGLCGSHQLKQLRF